MAESDPDAHESRSPRLLFLGAFADRKGFPLVLQAWPLVVAQLPEARLTLAGQGPLELLARQAARQPSVDLWVNPPRDRIRALLRHSAVLVLPSRRGLRWREQVGLPIVEGLSFGCTVVTSTETGLAGWLGRQGHHLLAPSCDAEQLADALVNALSDPVAPSRVLASLPALDGRLAADAWLFEDDHPLASPSMASSSSYE